MKNCINCGDQDISLFYFYEEKGGRHRYRCKVCTGKQSKKSTDKRKEANLAQHRKRRKEQRLKVLQYYSGADIPFCACCKEDILEFLVIDHLYGCGTAHRREIGYNLVAYIIKNNFPSIFRVLCSNCNSCLGTYGYCPHERVRHEAARFNDPALT